MRKRYEEIVEHAKPLFVAPRSVPYILEKIFWPLRHAISAYMLGNYLTVVALCGMVSEMIAVLWLEMAKFTINGNPITEPKIKALYGKTFEKMGQEQRVKILWAYELISEENKASFDSVRNIRRKYLHLLSQNLSQIAEDALLIFEHTAKLVESALGLGLSEGKVTFSPIFDQWFKENLGE